MSKGRKSVWRIDENEPICTVLSAGPQSSCVCGGVTFRRVLQLISIMSVSDVAPKTQDVMT
jgi:hypothetical protein